MADKQIAVEINCETGEVTERELTAAEIADRKKAADEFAAKQAQDAADAKAKADKRAEIATKLGLSEDDLAALIG